MADENLVSHLANFGIEAASSVKTEMSMAEMNLEANKLLDVLPSEGANLEPVFGPGYTGLRNIGNTCYMNSVLQVKKLLSYLFFFFLTKQSKTLFALPQFRSEFSEDKWEKHHRECKEREPAKCWLCQTGKLVYGLTSGKYSVRPDEKTVEAKQEERKFSVSICFSTSFLRV